MRRMKRPYSDGNLAELGLTGEFATTLMGKLADTFTLDELRAAIKATKLLLVDRVSSEDHTVARGIWMRWPVPTIKSSSNRNKSFQNG